MLSRSSLARITTALKNQQVKFVLVGGWNTLAGYLIFVGVSFFGLAPMNTLIVSYAFSLPLAFILQRSVVFQSVGPPGEQFAKFAVSNGVLFICNILTVPAAITVLDANPLVVQAFFVVVTAFLSYFAHKYYSFAK